MRQLELNLINGNGEPPPPSNWSYRLTKDGLIEELGNKRYVYGAWDRFFGCWEIDLETRTSREIIPDWPILNGSGVWVDPEENGWKSREGSIVQPAPRWRYEAKAAFAGYFSTIPSRTRGLISSLGTYQWLALDLIWQVPAFARFLDQEVFADNEQYIFACFTLSRISWESRKRRRELAQLIMTRKRREFLSELSGSPCRKATIRMLIKLGGEPQKKEVYLNLIESMNTPKLAKILSHAKQVTPELITTLNTLPTEFRLPNIPHLLLDQDTEIYALAVLKKIIEQLDPGERGKVADSFRHIRSLDELDDWHSKWGWKFLRHESFPFPPFPGTDRLRPLTNIDALLKEARRMGNCLDTLIEDVLDGGVYFYHWVGPEPATVMLRSDCQIGWGLYEALGKNNEGLKYVTRQLIEETVAEQLEPKERFDLQMRLDRLSDKGRT